MAPRAPALSALYIIRPNAGGIMLIMNAAPKIANSHLLLYANNYILFSINEGYKDRSLNDIFIYQDALMIFFMIFDYFKRYSQIYGLLLGG